MVRPLDGIRVLDLSLGPVAGMATMVLADFGADVVKVEPPGGDPGRATPHAPLWLRGKRSIELDSPLAQDCAELLRLAAAADVLVTTAGKQAASASGWAYSVLAEANPRLVYCRITGFGDKGPYAGYPADERIVAARSGRMRAFAGVADRDGPAFTAVQVGNHACAQAAVAGIVAALHERETSNRGQLVETDLLRAMLPYDLLGLLRTQLVRRHPERFADDPMVTAGRLPTLNYHPLPTADGRWLQTGNLLQHLFDNFLMASGLEDALAEPRYGRPQAQWSPDDREELRERLLVHFRSRPAADWMEDFVKHGGVAATEFRTTAEALDDPDLVLNGHVIEQDHPELGRVRMLGVLARLDETSGVPGSPSRFPGEDNDTLPGLWTEPAPVRPATSLRATSGGPLSGTTILEFATIIAAPLGVSFLADLGARVIKVEPVGGDPYRGMGLFGMMAAKTNASKQSIAIDLKSAEGLAIVESLIARSDAVIHNYRPGVPERLGIGYDQCKRLRPAIVHVSVNGYGPRGPGAHRPSTHPIPGAAIGGATVQAGGAHRWASDDVAELRAIATRLFRANEANPDPNTSVVVASATLLALLAQRRFGIGQEVFVDMLGANAYANADDFLDYVGKPQRPTLGRDLLGLSATCRLYPAAEGWVYLSLPDDPAFQRFCEVAGQQSLSANALFATRDSRSENDELLAVQLASVFALRSASEWELMLAPRGLGCVSASGPLPGEFWLDDAHVRENELVVAVEHPRYGSYLRWGPLVQFDRTEAACGPGALGGGDTAAILHELGYSPGQVDGLRERAVVWSEGAAPFA